MPAGLLSRAAAVVAAAGGVSQPGIWERLASVPDPRSPRGCSYPLPSLLAVWLCGLTAAGHDSARAVGQWVRRATAEERTRLRLPFDPFTGRHRIPDESTLRRVMTTAGRRALAAALLGEDLSGGADTTTGEDPGAVAVRDGGRVGGSGSVPGALAVDGKTSRGARRPDGSQVHFLFAVTHGEGYTVSQVEVDQKSNETRVFRTLLRGLDLTGVTVTFDALLTVRANLDWLVTVKGGHYVAVVKRNQPTLYRRLAVLPWTEIPTVFTERDHGHGRDETRTVTAATVTFLDFPHAVQAVRISRWRRVTGHAASRETRYAITSHSAAMADPRMLAALVRGQWTIENRSHHVRDVTFREDASTLRARNLPANLATIRCAIINRLRRAGSRFIPDGRRDHTRPTEALDLHGFP